MASDLINRTRTASCCALPKATTRSPGEDPLAIWRTADRLGLTVSCGGDGAGFASAEFAETIRALPALRIVIEHLGSVSRRDLDEVQQARRKAVFGLARFPNTCIKVTGLGEFSERAMPVPGGFPFVQPIPPLLEEAYAAFGPSRMMWGSDFPPVAGREGYRAALNLTRDQFATKPLLYAENDDMVVLSSEEIALRRVFPDPALVPRELAAKEVRWWLN